MQFFKNILVAIDFKEAEQAEIDHALTLAKHQKAKITLMSVIHELPKNAELEISAMSPAERTELKISKRQAQIDEVAECLKDHDIKVETVVTSGVSSTEIIKQVIRNNHDLLMISERDNATIKNKLFGSTAIQILRKCPCPVMAVHPDHPGEYKNVMASIDVTKEDDYDNDQLNTSIIQTAHAIAQTENSELSVQNIPPSEAVKEEHLERIKHCLAEHHVEVEEKNIFLDSGDVISTIANASKNHDIDLLVMGMLSRTGIKGFFIGNTVEKIMDNVECSVLTIKPKEFVSPITLDD